MSDTHSNETPNAVEPQTTSKSPDAHRLIWLDMEMTGLNPLTDRILEVAMVVTDGHLNTIAESPVLAIHQSDAVLDKMDEWNVKTHGRSGLIERVRQSELDEAAAELMMLDFLHQHVRPGKSPMCGNSICQDRRFMAMTMPRLEAFFHYRNLDVSTLKELWRRWQPHAAEKFVKKTKHTALSDVYESIEELKFYREHFLRVGNL